MPGELVDSETFTFDDLNAFQAEVANGLKPSNDRQNKMWIFLLLWPLGKPLPKRLVVKLFSDGAVNFDADGFRFASSERRLDEAIERKRKQLGLTKEELRIVRK